MLDPSDVREHDELFQRAAAILKALLPDRREARGARDQIAQARSMLKRVLKLNSRNFAAMWYLGLAHRLQGDDGEAYQWLAKAYRLAPQQRDVGRELALQCMRVGLGKEALAVSSEVVRQHPADAGLMANHALALLINGRIAEANATVAAADRTAPGDKKIIALSKLIDDVANGQRPRPTSWRE